MKFVDSVPFSRGSYYRSYQLFADMTQNRHTDANELAEIFVCFSGESERNDWSLCTKTGVESIAFLSNDGRVNILG